MNIDKNQFYQILTKIYGKVEKEYNVDCKTKLEHYKGHIAEKPLIEIYNELVAYRGFNNFIRRENLSRCDFYIPELNIVIEIDERQHFSIPRSLTFKHYPINLQTGFSIDQWTKLCLKNNAKDNHPEYRDEQRAWYDTLRDFLPLISGYKPTIRFTYNDPFIIGLDISNNNHLIDLQNKIAILSKGVEE